MALFIREGAAAFSARRVAKEAKLSLGSVQHVFPTTDALLVAMLEYVVTSYDDAYARMSKDLPLSLQARWDAVVDYLLQDICSHDTRRFFLGFWALSCHNRVAGTLLQQAYAYHLKNLGGFIAALRPDLGEAQCHLLATQVAVLIDGSMIFTAPGTKMVSRKALIQTAKQSIRRLIQAAEPAKE